MENMDWIDELYDCYKDFWLKGKVFRKTAWTNGDHQHCFFDGKRISSYDIEGNDRQGYAAVNGGIWLCTECFEACAARHPLPMIKNTVGMIKEALQRDRRVVISCKNDQYFINSEESAICVEHNGEKNEYKNIEEMFKNQMFYGKLIDDVIEDIYLGVF